MPRLRIIVLDQAVPGTWRYLLWADVPAARQAFYTSTSAKSEWKDALAPDNINLQQGIVAEQAGFINTPGFTVPQLQAELQARWTDFQNEVNAKNPWTRYGSAWNGTTWTSTGAS